MNLPCFCAGCRERRWQRLTVSQRNVAVLIGEGTTRKEIYAYAAIKPRTVDKHATDAYRRLRVRSAVELTHLLLLDKRIKNGFSLSESFRLSLRKRHAAR